jgi:hypothetical protein
LNKTLRAAAFTLAFGAAGFAGAQTFSLEMGPNYAGGAQFNCNSLYAVESGQGSATVGATGARVFRVDLSASGAATTSLPLELIYRPSVTTLNTNPMAIAALGIPANANDLQMWHLNTTAASSTPANFRYVSNGATSGNIWGVARAPGTATTSTWSGAEFNQVTGEIILSAGGAIGTTGTNSAGNGRLGIFDTGTGDTRVSSILSPAPGTAAVTGTISSDMVVDADDNIYIIVGNGNNNTGQVLIRVVSGDDGQPWYYNQVVTLTGDAVNATKPGMTYLNGKIYFASNTGTGTCGTGRCLMEVDVLSGTMTQRGIMTASTQPLITNLAACQAAPVIQGRVYLDTSAAGDPPFTPVPGTTPVLANVSVQIYKEEGGDIVYKGTRQTDAAGYYSFIVDSASATYYIRVQQLGQTWASAGGVGNVTTALCDVGGNSQWNTASGPCKGVIEYPALGTLSMEPVSKVVMGTDREVANADFAIAQAGDVFPPLPGNNLNNLSNSRYDCHSLYSTDTTTTYRIDNPTVSAAATPLYQIPGLNQSTIALGYRYGVGKDRVPLDQYGNPDPTQRLMMYHWYWGDGGPAVKVVVVESGNSGWAQLVPSPPGDRTTPGTNYWSGGEVRQRTGEIFFSGGEGDRLGINYSMMVFNPVTGVANQSGMIQPASPSDEATFGGTTAPYRYVASDMAVDAEGNAYIVVGQSSNSKLVRVVPGTDYGGTNYNAGNWKYNVVLPLKNMPGGTLWGMAFLDGVLYVKNSSNGSNSSLYAVDVFTGQATVVPGTGSGQFDLAACQVSPVVKGVVYDTSGTVDGMPIPGTTPGAAGIRVDIYKIENGVPVFKGSRVTGGTGDYSFIVDSWQATYYLRVRQPKIGGTVFGTDANSDSYGVNLGGVNAAQTWVGVGTDELNITTALCYDEATNQPRWISAPGACEGVRRFGSDPAGPAATGSPWNNIESQAQYLTKVVMNSDMEVVHIDFGFSAAASYGDAPGPTFLSPWMSGGPAHVITGKPLYLGNSVTSYPDGTADLAANRNTTDDGVFVLLPTINNAGGVIAEEVPLQDIALANAKTYKFKARVNGPERKSGYLNIWDSGATAPVLKTGSPGNAGLQDPMDTGEIAFDYRTQATATGGAAPIFLRARFSTTPGLPAQTAAAAPGAGQPAWGDPAADAYTPPWVVNGEVEDYRTWQAPALVRLVAMSTGRVDTFGYLLPAAAPNPASSITTMTVGVPAREASSYIHGVTAGQPVTVSQTLPQVPVGTPGKWALQGVTCVDAVDGPVPVTANADGVTIPAGAVSLGADITCIFSNRFVSADPTASTLGINSPGPVYTASGPAPNSYTATVTANDSTGVPQEGVDIALFISSGTMAGTATGSFTGLPTTGTCTTGASGTCAVTWTSTGPGTLQIAATLENVPISGSPQTRQFVNHYDLTRTVLTADKTTVTAGGASVDQAALTVTLKDASGATTTSVGTTTVAFGNSTPGTFSAPSCDIAQGASSCSVTISSLTTGTAHVTAMMDGGTQVVNSPLTITFVNSTTDCTNSTLTVSPATRPADGASTSTVTVTLKDTHGVLITTPAQVTFALPGSNYGSLPASCETDTVTGSCSVTYISPSTVPDGTSQQTFKVTATLPSCGTKTADMTLTDGGNRNVIVTKAVIGSGKTRGYIVGGKFNITVQCGTAAPVPLQLADGQSNDGVSGAYPPVIAQAGDTCTVSEDEPTTAVVAAGFTNMAAYPSSIVVGASDRTIEVFNTVTEGNTPTASLTVSKTVSGATANQDAASIFAINATCGAAVGTVNLMDQEQGYIDVPANTSCTISEPSPPSALNGYSYLPNIKPSVIPSLPSGGQATVKVENRVTNDTNQHKVNLTNAVSEAATGLIGLSGYTTGGQFNVKLDCGATSYTDTMVQGYTYSYYVPNNSNCSTQTNPPLPSLNSGYTFDRHTDTLSNPVTADQSATVTHQINYTTTPVGSTLEVTTNGPIYTSDHYTVTVTARDASNVIQPNVGILLTVTGGAMTATATGIFPPGSLATGTCTTGADGTCAVTWASTAAGTFNVSATLGGTGISSSPQTRQFVTNPVASQSELTASKTSVTAGGADTATLTVTLKDASGATTTSVGTTTVTFSGSTPGTFSAPSCDIAQGASSCFVTISSMVTGTAHVAATLGGAAVKNSPLDIIFGNSSVDCTNSTLTANPAALDADGASHATITVTLKDTAGVLISDTTTVNFTVPNLGGTLSAAFCQTVNGTCQVIYTSPYVVPAGGKSTVTAALGCGGKTVDIALADKGNRYINVTKTVMGSGYTGVPFNVTVACGAATPTVLQLTDGGQGSVVAHDGDDCSVTEDNPGASVIGAGNTNTAVIAPAKFHVNGVNEDVAIANRISSGTLPKGTLMVSKVITGSNPDITAGHIASNRFNITVACASTPVAAFSLKANQTASVEGAVGQSCTISEPAVPLANPGYKYVANFDPGTVMSLRAGSRDVTVQNKVVPDDGTPYYTVSLTNAVSGDKMPSLYNNTGTFTLQLQCGTFSTSPSMYVGDVSAYSVAGTPGAICNVSTTAWPAILDPTTYTWYADTYNPANPIAVTGNVNEVATHVLDKVSTRTITISKSVAGPAKAAGYVAGGKFALSVQCGSAPAIPLSLADGQSDSSVTATVGDTCTITEAEPSASVVRSGFTNTAVIYPSSFLVADNTAVNVVNRIENGTFPKKVLTVTKYVTAATPADKTAGLIAGSQFGIYVTCAGTTDADLTLQDGWVATVETGAGQSCAITEPVVPGANTGYQYVTNFAPATTIMPSAASAKAGIDATVENMLAPSSVTFHQVTLSNAVIGDQMPTVYDHDSQFTLTMTCGAPYNYTIPMYVSDTAIRQVPASTSCTMNTIAWPTITDHGYKWYVDTYSQLNPFTVSNADVTNVATHQLAPAQMRTVTVKKTVLGGTAAGTFSIHVGCSDGNAKDMTLASGGTDTIQTLENSTCTVTERNDAATAGIGSGNSYTALIVPSGFTVPDNDDLVVNVTNRIETGKTITKSIVTVTKQVKGEIALGHNAAALFNVHVDCTDTTAAAFDLLAGQSATVEAEQGQSCTTTEPVIPAANAGYKYAPSIAPQISLVPATGLVVTVTNTVVPSSTVMRQVTLTNAVSGDTAPSKYNQTQPFTVTLNCGAGTPYDFGPIAMLVGAVGSYSVPNASTCSMNTDTASLPATDAAYEWFNHIYDPAVSFPVNGDVPAIVTHALRPVGFYLVTVTKIVEGGAASGTFSITLDCGGAYVKPMTLASGASDSLMVPNGASCSVTEKDDAAAAGIGAGNSYTAVIAPSGFTVNGKDVAVGVRNRIGSGPISKGILTVTKTVTGNTAADIEGNVFGINVACTGAALASFNLEAKQSATVEAALGQPCTVTEPAVTTALPLTQTPAPLAGYMYLPIISPSSTTLTSSRPTGSVTVENMVAQTGTYRKLTLTNAVDGPATAYNNNGFFTLALNCVSPFSWTRDMYVNDTSIFYVPDGNNCTLTTNARPNIIDPAAFKWDGDTDNLVNPVRADQNVTATHKISGTTAATFSTLTVDPAGPLGTTYYATNNSYTVTVTANNSSGTPQPNVAINMTVDGGALAGAGAGTFAGGVCTTGPAGTCTMTWTSANESPPAGFAIHAKLGTADIGNCGSNPNTCSPQSRVFYGPVPANGLTLAANPATLVANGATTSTITATVKDSSGNLVLTPTTVNFTALASTLDGTLSGLTCNTQATGICTITYTSPQAVPVAGKATVTASLAGVSGSGKSVDITLTDSGDFYSVIINKTVTGSGYVAGQTFGVTLICTGMSIPKFQLAGGGQKTIVVPNGATCSVSEDEPGAAVIGAGNTNMSSIAPSSFTMSGQNETVEITNRIVNSPNDPKGVLNVSKRINGDTAVVSAGHIASNQFDINVSCTGGTATVPDAAFKLKGAQSATVEVERGSACTISEPLVTLTLPLSQAPAANPGYMYVPSIRPMTIPKMPVSRDVTVTNTVEPVGAYYPVTLKNVVANDQTPSLYNPNGAFTLDVSCGSFHETPTLFVGEVASYGVQSGLPCNVGTTDRPSIIDTSMWQWDPETYSPLVPFTVNGAKDEIVTHPLGRTSFGAVTVTKRVTVTGGGYVTGGRFNITLNCGPGYTWNNVSPAGRTDGLAKDETSQVYLVPLTTPATICTVTEADPGAAVIGTGYSSTAVINPSQFDVTHDTPVTVTNRIASGPVNKATLQITKSVLDSYGGDVAGNVFTIHADCAGTPAVDFYLQDGWSGTVQGQVGALCTVTEPAPLPLAQIGYKYVANNTGTVTLQADNGNTPGAQITIENMVAPSSVTLYPVTVTNAVNNDATPTAYNQAQPFVLTMSCDAGADYVWSVSQNIGNTRDFNVPAGAHCTMGTSSRPAILDPSQYKWDLTVGTLYTPASPFTVTGAMRETAAHTIAPVGLHTVTVMKTVTGSGTTASQFAIHVTCNDGVTRPAMNLAAGGSATFQAMENTACTVTEDQTAIAGGNGYTALIVPSGFKVPGDDNLVVTVENRIETGTVDPKALIKVTKYVNGDPAYKALGHDAATAFNIHVDCVGTAPAVFSLPEGWSATVEGKVGQQCAITEPDPLPATKDPSNYKYIVSSISPSQTTLPATGIDARVTNTVDRASVTAHKVTLTNSVLDVVPSGYIHTGQFVLSMNCGTPGAASDPYNFGQVSMFTGDVSTFNVPDGANCAVDTVSRPALVDPTMYVWYRDNYTPPVPLSVRGDVDESVSHAITGITMRTITVSKAVTGVTAANGPFVIHVDCGGSNRKDMVLADNGSDTMLAPLSAVCNITEDEPAQSVIGAGNNNTAVIVPSTFVVAGDQAVQVTNRIGSGIIPPANKATLTVTKSVTGNTAAHIATNLFGIRVACTSTAVATFNLMENQSATVQGKIGDVCTTTEPVIPATSVTGYHYAPNIWPSKTTLSSDTDVSVDNTVTNLPTHLVTLTNTTIGPTPQEYDHSGQFTLVLDCTGFGSKTSSLVVGDASSYSIPDGMPCTVTTTGWPAPGSLDEWDPAKDTYSLGNPFTTQAADETDVVGHWLQRIGSGPVAITKTMTGNTGLYAGGTFNVALACSDGTHQTFTFAPTGTSAPVMVAVGAMCTVTEDVSHALLSGGTSRRTINPSKFIVEDTGGVTVSVENELLDGPVSLAPLEVAKQVTGDMAGNDPASVFGITAACPATSSSIKTFNLMNGWSGMTDALIGDTCTIAEPVVPPALSGYQYSPGIIPSLVSIPAGGRNAVVQNNLGGAGPTVTIVLTQGATVNPPGSGYVAGVLETTLTCTLGGVSTAYSLKLQEGDTATLNVAQGASCAAARGTTLPMLNGGFTYSAPNISTGSWPYVAGQSGSASVWYIISAPPPVANVPIPALDPKALLLLIGLLLAGAMFWQSRQKKRPKN